MWVRGKGRNILVGDENLEATHFCVGISLESESISGNH